MKPPTSTTISVAQEGDSCWTAGSGAPLTAVATGLFVDVMASTLGPAPGASQSAHIVEVRVRG